MCVWWKSYLLGISPASTEHPQGAAHTQTHPGSTAQLLCAQGTIPLPYELSLTPWNRQQPFHLGSGCDKSTTASLASDGKCDFMKTRKSKSCKSQNPSICARLLKSFTGSSSSKSTFKICTFFSLESSSCLSDISHMAFPTFSVW